ncbi:MAG: hypothetical protein K8R41_12395 [Bacteroidales bacterium]|nr:hypothetical protein [Bacteroidales bacterium]
MYKSLIKLCKIAGRSILAVIILLFAVLLFQYLFAPYYIFPEVTTFKGEKFYNPYKEMNSENWKKGNFQVQSRVWFGITNGWKNSNELIDSTYSFLDYDIICTSDYMKINKYKKNSTAYIPVYEHGYGIKKNHQVCIGAKKVTWRDYSFTQSIHHKQHIINLLRDKNELVIIAHPKLRHGYSPDDFKYLTNYDGIEVLNNYRKSIEHWDAALSSGHFATIIGNDDAHDITNPDEVGQFCTYINTNSLAKDSVIDALQQGNAFAIDIYRPIGESFERKKEKLKEIALLQKFDIRNDTLFVEIDKLAKEFIFIGQDGKPEKSVKKTKKAFYKIQPEDTYIRTEIKFKNRNTIYLNPVFRYSDGNPIISRKAEIDVHRTLIFRIIALASIIFVIINFVFIFRKIKRKREK